MYLIPLYYNVLLCKRMRADSISAFCTEINPVVTSDKLAKTYFSMLSRPIFRVTLELLYRMNKNLTVTVGSYGCETKN